MRGLLFEQEAQIAPSSPNRADVACFVGLVARRVAELEDGSSRVLSSIVPPPSAPSGPSPIYRWLLEQGWVRSRERIYAGASTGVDAVSLTPAAPPWARSDEEIDALLDVPVPIESFETFARLFAWELRPLGTDAHGARVRGPTYLGAAVRSFFAQGGRRCYVVRVGDPFGYDASVEERRRALPKLLGLRDGELFDPHDRATFRGVGHLHGLPDVSFLCLPDLADACAGHPDPLRLERPEPIVEPVFAPCAEPVAADPRDRESRSLAAPRLEEAGYEAWAEVLRTIARTLRSSLREVQLVASIPLPDPELELAGRDLLAYLEERGVLASDSERHAPGESLSSAFVQLVWPWVETRNSEGLPERLESPDGVLTGVLARNALVRGTYRSCARRLLTSVIDLQPRLRCEDLEVAGDRDALVRHVSLFGRTARGVELLSDVTTSADEAYRQAAVQRLMTAIVRAARVLGEESTFEASGPRLWSRLRRTLESLLTALWRDGALDGASAREAFQVRCDRSTMSSSDLEKGRVLVDITLQPSVIIERIRVVLTLSKSAATLVRTS